MGSLKVSTLECPACGGALDGLDSDTVFTCRPCLLGVDILNGHKTRIPLVFAPSATETDLPVIYLPVWKLAVSVQVKDESGSDVTASTAAAGLDTVWVCGFHENRPSYFGNPGMDLTENRTCLLGDMEPPLRARVAGIGRGYEDAKKYARVFVTFMMDKRKDVTGLDIQVIVGRAELWALPFADDAENRLILDLATGKTYSSALVECLPGIRACTADR